MRISVDHRLILFNLSLKNLIKFNNIIGDYYG
jgi:hypothetical protein